MLDEVYAVDYVGVPGYFGQINEEAEELDQDTNADSLSDVSVLEVFHTLASRRYRYSQKDSDHYSCQHGQSCLLVVLTSE